VPWSLKGDTTDDDGVGADDGDVVADEGDTGGKEVEDGCNPIRRR